MKKKTKSRIEEGRRHEYRLNIDVLFTQWGDNLSLDSLELGEEENQLFLWALVKDESTIFCAR